MNAYPLGPPAAHTELRGLAEAAAPGPWRLEYGHPPTQRWTLWSGTPTGYPIVLSANVPPAPQDAAYIAACSPDRVLALLDERDRLRKALMQCAQRFYPALDGGPDYSDDRLYSEIERLLWPVPTVPETPSRLGASPVEEAPSAR